MATVLLFVLLYWFRAVLATRQLMQRTLNILLLTLQLGLQCQGTGSQAGFDVYSVTE